jgi:hypothetical protein
MVLISTTTCIGKETKVGFTPFILFQFVMCVQFQSSSFIPTMLIQFSFRFWFEDVSHVGNQQGLTKHEAVDQ